MIDDHARHRGMVARRGRGAGGQQRQPPVAPAPVEQAAQIPRGVLHEPRPGECHGRLELRPAACRRSDAKAGKIDPPRGRRCFLAGELRQPLPRGQAVVVIRIGCRQRLEAPSCRRRVSAARGRHRQPVLRRQRQVAVRLPVYQTAQVGERALVLSSPERRHAGAPQERALVVRLGGRLEQPAEQRQSAVDIADGDEIRAEEQGGGAPLAGGSAGDPTFPQVEPKPAGARLIPHSHGQTEVGQAHVRQQRAGRMLLGKCPAGGSGSGVVALVVQRRHALQSAPVRRCRGGMSRGPLVEQVERRRIPRGAAQPAHQRPVLILR